MYCMGVCCKRGLGLEQDLAQAVHWYEKAVEAGLPAAMCSLGVCYENGEGVSEDLEQAAALYRRAAEQGDAAGQCNLGYL